MKEICILLSEIFSKKLVFPAVYVEFLQRGIFSGVKPFSGALYLGSLYLGSDQKLTKSFPRKCESPVFPDFTSNKIFFFKNWASSLEIVSNLMQKIRTI